MNVLITICARGGSKGIPGKNIKLLSGKPLIYYTIDMARRFAERYNADIALSTDDDMIIQSCSQYGLHTNYKRPASLATDSAGKIDTIKDILSYSENGNKIEYDFILDLDVTSPLRTLEDIETAFEAIQSNEKALNLFSVNIAIKNPYFNMVEANEEGFFSLSKRASDGNLMTRQSAPAVYELNASFYFYKKAFFDQQLTSAITNYSLIHKMDHICFDLDHSIDFEFLDFLINNNKLDFQI